MFPLGNGVCLYSKGKLCTSIIDQSGNKRVSRRDIKQNKKFFDLPFIRGLTYFFLGIYLYVLAYLSQVELDDRKEEEKNKSFKSAQKLNLTSGFIVLIAGLIFAFLFGFLALGILPNHIFNSLFPTYLNYYFRSFMIALIRTLLIYAIFVILRFLPFMSGLYSFNGAGCEFLKEKEGKEMLYSRTEPLNFLNFLLNVFLISTFMVSLIAVNIVFWANFLINLCLFLLCIIIVYELLLLTSKSNIHFLKDIALVTNFLVCIKPNITHTEVMQVAKIELSYDSTFEKVDKEHIPMSALYAEMQTKLNQSERFESSDIDWIVATVLGKNRAEVKLVRQVSAKEYRDIMRACERRAKGEPLSSIFGFVDFYGLKIDVNKKVLSPRMETELLVDEVIKKAREIEAKNILDLCCGSGAIGIAIAKYTDCKVTASDISRPALLVAENNAKKNDVKIDFILSDLFNNLKKARKYDIIVSNPPYIKSADIEKLDVEVKKYDPRIALDGGEDGLDFYKRILESAHKKLAKKGWLYFEVGMGQAGKIQDMMLENGFSDVQVLKDYNKIERIVYGRITK